MRKIIFSLVLILFIQDAKSQWEQTNGPEGGYILDLINTNNQIFACASRAGVFKSTNNGAAWTKVNNGISSERALCLIANGTNIIRGHQSIMVCLQPG